MDVAGLGLTDYYDIIKNPMDLGTVKNKLESNSYTTVNDVIKGVQLTWRNAFIYNPRGSGVYRYAQALAKEFVRLVDYAKRGNAFLLCI